MANYYTPSNKFSPLSILFLIIACLTIIPILSLIYSYAVSYIPFPYINFFITAGFGFLIGLAVQYLVINLGKVRNPMLAAFFGLLGGLAGLYFSWAVWVSVVMESPEVMSTSLSLASQPSGLFEIIGQLNEVGVWGLKGSVVNGTPLTIVWVLEALIIVGLGVMISTGKSDEPFCEVNQKWFEEKTLPAFNLITNPQDCMTALEIKNTSYFHAIEKIGNPEKERSLLMVK